MKMLVAYSISRLFSIFGIQYINYYHYAAEIDMNLIKYLYFISKQLIEIKIYYNRFSHSTSKYYKFFHYLLAYNFEKNINIDHCTDF